MPTLSAGSPSLAAPASSLSASCADRVGPVVYVPHGRSPVLVDLVALVTLLPERTRREDRHHFKFYELRDNLRASWHPRLMAIRAVVFDIGSVLEVIDESVFPLPFLERHGLRPETFEAIDFGGDPALGQVTQPEVIAAWRNGLGLDEEEIDELEADYWRWYTGTLDEKLMEWFAAQRLHPKTRS